MNLQVRIIITGFFASLNLGVITSSALIGVTAFLIVLLLLGFIEYAIQEYKNKP